MSIVPGQHFTGSGPKEKTVGQAPLLSRMGTASLIVSRAGRPIRQFESIVAGMGLVEAAV